MRNNTIIRTLLIIGAVLFFFFVATGKFFTNIESGQKGLIFSNVNSDSSSVKIYQPGFHFIAPWHTLIVLDVQENNRDLSFTGKTAEGLAVEFTINYRYQPQADKLGTLLNDYGQNYPEQLLDFELTQIGRTVLEKYTTEALYSGSRSKAAVEMLEAYRESDEHDLVKLSGLDLEVQLPEKISKLIEEKIEETAQLENNRIRLEKEKLAAEIKAIAAESERNYQEKVNPGLTDKYLKLKGIAAIESLSTAPNSKVIIIGNEEGIPVILEDKTTE